MVLLDDGCGGSARGSQSGDAKRDERMCMLGAQHVMCAVVPKQRRHVVGAK